MARNVIGSRIEDQNVGRCALELLGHSLDRCKILHVHAQMRGVQARILAFQLFDQGVGFWSVAIQKKQGCAQGCKMAAKLSANASRGAADGHGFVGK